MTPPHSPPPHFPSRYFIFKISPKMGKCIIEVKVRIETNVLAELPPGVEWWPMTSPYPACSPRDPKDRLHPLWATLIHSRNIYVYIIWEEINWLCANKSLKLHFHPSIKLNGPKNLALILMPAPTSSVTFDLLNLSFLICKLGIGVHLPCSLGLRTKRDNVFRIIWIFSNW